jgi:hypothetical protein
MLIAFHNSEYLHLRNLYGNLKELDIIPGVVICGETIQGAFDGRSPEYLWEQQEFYR